ncbi:MAG: hypothetical protein OHK0038_18570 [Flammeovirgaceae bacterium]
MSCRFIIPFVILSQILLQKLWGQNLLEDNEKGLSRSIDQFFYQNWTTEQGLPASALLDVTQTHDGYLWIASYAGITRFDGVNFTNFNRLNTPQLSDNTIYHLLQTPDSTLWLATRAKGLVSYKNSIFKVHQNPNWQEEKAINTLFHFYSSKIWISTNLGENYLYDYQTNQFSDVPFEALKTARVYQIKKDQEGYFWIASSLGNIQKCKNNECQTIDQKFGLPTTTIETIHLDNQQTFWAGTARGLYYFDKTKNKFLIYKDLKNYHVRSIYLDLTGNLWVGTFTQTYRIHHKTRALDSLRHQDIIRVLGFWEDKEGSLWVASSTNGLFQIKSRNFLNIGMAHGLKFPTPQCFFQENKNKYWIGGSNGIVQIIENGQLKTVSFKNKLPNSGVFSIQKIKKVIFGSALIREY